MYRITKLLLTSLIITASSISSLQASWFSKKSKNTKAKIIRTYLPSKVTTIDPAACHDVYEAYMIRKVYEPLLTFNYTASGPELIPLLLEKMPKVSNDRLVYTLTLKKGIHFHNDPCFVATQGKGTEVTAKDVEYALVRVFDPAVPCKNLDFIAGIKGAEAFREARRSDPNTPYKIEGIEVIGKYTLRITLNHPIPELPYFLAMPFTSVVSKQAVAYYQSEFNFHAVGTGPWTMSKKFNPRATKIIFSKNPAYHGTFPEIASPSCNHMKEYVGKRLPLADALHIELIPAQSAAWLKFAKGELDIALWQGVEVYVRYLTPEKKAGKELQRKGIQVLPKVSNGMMFAHFNLNIDYLQNVKVRQAFALATNLQRIIEVVFDNNASVPQGIILPGFESQGYDPAYRSPYGGRYNVEKAKKLLAEAGFPKGEGIPPFVLYISSSTSMHQKLAECIKEDWKKIGIKVHIIGMPFNDLLTKAKKIGTTTWSGHFVAWSLDLPDMINMFQLFYGKNIGGNNGSFYNNKAFNALYERAAMMKPGAKRTALYKKMNSMLAEEMPSMPIYIGQAYTFHQKRIKNMMPFNPMIYDQDKYLDVEK